MELIKIQLSRLSFIYEKKAILIFLFGLLLSLIIFSLSLGFGETKFSIFTVLKVLINDLLNHDLFTDISKFQSLVISKFRLPRTLAAFLVGASLALSGAIVQNIVKNPLASPDLLGISSGGLLGTLFFLTIFTDPYANTLKVSIAYMPIFSFMGAIIAAILVYFLAYKRGVTPYRLILIGIAISGAFTAINNLLIINGPLIMKLESNTWLAGTVYGTTIDEVRLLAIWLFVGVLISIFFVRDLNVLNLDDKIVISLGSKIERNRLLLLLLSTAIASGAVAIGGAIGFVGLLAPHICRKLINMSFGNQLPLTLLVGGSMVVLADLIGRTIIYPIEIPSGVFTSLIGAPFFMYLLWKRK